MADGSTGEHDAPGVVWRVTMKPARRRLWNGTAPAGVLIGGSSSLLVLGQQYVDPGLAGFPLGLTACRPWSSERYRGGGLRWLLWWCWLGLVDLFVLLSSGGPA